MEFETPTWLTIEFIRCALQGGNDSPDNGPITIEDLDIDKPLGIGENYCSDILRVSVTYRNTKNISSELLKASFIIKIPKIGSMTEILLKTGVIQKEIRMYNEYIPKMNTILDTKNTITAVSFYSTQEFVLVLQDLRFEGYKMADRQALLDYDHTAIALKKLAIFHAASVRLHEEEPKFVEHVGEEGFFNEMMADSNKDFSKICFALTAAEAKKTPSLSRYYDQLMTYSENSWDILVEMMKPKKENFNVLNHGDYWVNNVLFRYDDKDRPIDMKMIDLQLSRYAPPAFDLFYLFYSSVLEEIRINKMVELLKIYLQELNSNLEKFGSNQRLTESKINDILEECDFLSLLITLRVYPIVVAGPKESTMDVTQFTERDFNSIDNNPMSRFYCNERFLKTIESRFLEFEKRGWFPTKD